MCREGFSCQGKHIAVEGLDRKSNSGNDSVLYFFWGFSHGSFTTLGNCNTDKDATLHLFLLNRLLYSPDNICLDLTLLGTTVLLI